jgi:hypothetical protein
MTAIPKDVDSCGYGTPCAKKLACLFNALSVMPKSSMRRAILRKIFIHPFVYVLKGLAQEPSTIIIMLQQRGHFVRRGE